LKEFLSKYRWHATAALAAISIAILFYFSQNKNMDSTEQKYTPSETAVQPGAGTSAGDTAGAQSGAAEAQVPDEIYVDVKGAVKHPGIYKADMDERVYDLIQKAGGFEKNADQSQVNLAQRVKDEMVIQVPEKGKKTVPAQPAGTASGTAAQPASDAASGTPGEAAEKININTADEAQLETLPGIGPSKARAIIEYREKNGPFQKPEDLKNVSGIGDQTFAKIESSITLQ